MAQAKISPSILAADFAHLGEEIEAVSEGGADFIHIDVMDGHFVPNISMGPAVVKGVRGCTQLPFDVHLMVSPVDPYIRAFAEAGADILTVHPEAGPHLHRTIELIKSFDVKAGVALNPATPVSLIEPVIDDVDLVLIMSVNPGFGGQKFIASQLDKVRAVRALLDSVGSTAMLEVDGGVDNVSAPKLREAGADVLVAGSYIFGGEPADYSDKIRTLRGA